MPRRYTVSDKLREANKIKAKKPRGAWAGTPERARLEQAKEILREVLPDGARMVAEFVRDATLPAELRLAAFKIASERAGLPIMTQQELAVVGDLQQRQTWVVEGGLGWPEVGGGVGDSATSGDHDGSHDRTADRQH